MLRYPVNASPQKTLAYAAQNIAEPSRNPPVTLLLRADLPPNATPPKRPIAHRAERLFWV